MDGDMKLLKRSGTGKHERIMREREREREICLPIYIQRERERD